MKGEGGRRKKEGGRMKEEEGGAQLVLGINHEWCVEEEQADWTG